MKNGVFWDVTPCGSCRLLVTAGIFPSSPILVTLMMEAQPTKRQFLQEAHCVTSQKRQFFRFKYLYYLSKKLSKLREKLQNAMLIWHHTGQNESYNSPPPPCSIGIAVYIGIRYERCGMRWYRGIGSVVGVTSPVDVRAAMFAPFYWTEEWTKWLPLYCPYINEKFSTGVDNGNLDTIAEKTCLACFSIIEDTRNLAVFTRACE
jgi:hypothetical protein